MARAGSLSGKNKQAKVCSDRKTQVQKLCTAGATDFVGDAAFWPQKCSKPKPLQGSVS